MEAIQTFHNQFLFRIDFPEAKFEHHAVKNKDQAERQGYKKESLFFASFFCSIGCKKAVGGSFLYVVPGKEEKDRSHGMGTRQYGRMCRGEA